MVISSQALIEDYECSALVALEAAEYAQANRREFPPDWYDWQREGFDTFDKHVMIMAGNQTGKTWSASYHDACDLTANYPDDWTGFKFDHQIDMTVMGVDNTQLIDVLQKALFGTLNPITRRFSGGWVHADEIEHIDSSQVSGLAKNVYIKSRYGTSKCSLRAYTQSRTGSGSLPLAGTIKDVIHVDECPPDAIVGQLFMRTMNGNMGKGGRLRFSMTPELGVTQLVNSFMEERGPGQLLIGPVAWDDCHHLTPEKQAQILVGIPDHEHDMRSKGIPFFGSGLIYSIADSRITCEPFELSTKPWLIFLRAIDLGIDHPTAIVWLAFDRETNTTYMVKDYAESGCNAATNAAAANSMWKHVPLVFPHDVDQTEKGSGKTVREFYEDAGIDNAIDFENPDGSKYVEPGIMAIREAMENGTLKIFNTCEKFFREKRLYHRKDGKRVDLNNDVLDAMRYGFQMIPIHGEPMIGLGYTGKVTRAFA